MKRHSRLPLLLLAALVMALSYLGGALAPPLRSVEASRPAAPAITNAQWGALQSATELLLGDDADNLLNYLPLTRR